MERWRERREKEERERKREWGRNIMGQTGTIMLQITCRFRCNLSVESLSISGISPSLAISAPPTCAGTAPTLHFSSIEPLTKLTRRTVSALAISYQCFSPFILSRFFCTPQLRSKHAPEKNRGAGKHQALATDCRSAAGRTQAK